MFSGFSLNHRTIVGDEKAHNADMMRCPSSLPSVGSAGTITANRCSFFALEYSASIGFAAMGADFYIYYPTNTSKRLTFLMTWSGMWTAFIFADLVRTFFAASFSSFVQLSVS